MDRWTVHRHRCIPISYTHLKGVVEKDPRCRIEFKIESPLHINDKKNHEVRQSNYRLLFFLYNIRVKYLFSVIFKIWLALNSIFNSILWFFNRNIETIRKIKHFYTKALQRLDQGCRICRKNKQISPYSQILAKIFPHYKIQLENEFFQFKTYISKNKRGCRIQNFLNLYILHIKWNVKWSQDAYISYQKNNSNIRNFLWNQYSVKNSKKINKISMEFNISYEKNNPNVHNSFPLKSNILWRIQKDQQNFATILMC